MGKKILLIKYGELPKYLFCDQKGHIKKDCIKYKMKCEQCDLRGHQEFTMATKLTAPSEDFDDDTETNQTNQQDLLNLLIHTNRNVLNDSNINIDHNNQQKQLIKN